MQTKIGCSRLDNRVMLSYFIVFMFLPSNLNESLNYKIVERCKDNLLKKVKFCIILDFKENERYGKFRYPPFFLVQVSTNHTQKKKLINSRKYFENFLHSQCEITHHIKT